MLWSSSNTLAVRRLRSRIIDLTSDLQTARDVVVALRVEVVAARGINANLVDRLAAIEARLAALEGVAP